MLQGRATEDFSHKICCSTASVQVPAGPQPQHPNRGTWYWPSRLWRRVQTETSEPRQQRGGRKNTVILTLPWKIHTFFNVYCKPGSSEITCGTHLSKVVKVVLMVDPLIVGLQTVRLVGDVFDIGTQAVKELAFKELRVKGQRHQVFEALYLYIKQSFRASGSLQGT